MLIKQFLAVHIRQEEVHFYADSTRSFIITMTVFVFHFCSFFY